MRKTAPLPPMLCEQLTTDASARFRTSGETFISCHLAVVRMSRFVPTMDVVYS